MRLRRGPLWHGGLAGASEAVITGSAEFVLKRRTGWVPGGLVGWCAAALVAVVTGFAVFVLMRRAGWVPGGLTG